MFAIEIKLVSTHRLSPTFPALSYLNLFMSLHFYKNEWLKVSIISQTGHTGSLEGINQCRNKQTAETMGGGMAASITIKQFQEFVDSLCIKTKGNAS